MSLPASFAVFFICAVFIGFAGTRLSKCADVLADRTGLGEALMGAVFLGACTSLAGITASVTAASHGHAGLSLSNAFGGIAAQTAYLAVADMAYKKANLEHAAASLSNMLSATLLIILLGLNIIAMLGPEMSFFGIHPVTLILFPAYVFGIRMIARSEETPMWRPRMTEATKTDIPEENSAAAGSTLRMWSEFALCAVVVVIAGWMLTNAAETIAAKTGLTESFVGALMLGIVTSMSELVTTVAAIRAGALTMAVGVIMGGNMFDVLQAALSDFFYRSGSIYHGASRSEILLLAVTLLMTAVLVLGLMFRQKRGFANIGFESIIILIVYLGGVTLLQLM